MCKGPQPSSRWGGPSRARISRSDAGAQGAVRPGAPGAVDSFVRTLQKGWGLASHPGGRGCPPWARLPGLPCNLLFRESAGQPRAIRFRNSLRPPSGGWHGPVTLQLGAARRRINPRCFGRALDHRNGTRVRRLTEGNLHARCLVRRSFRGRLSQAEEAGPPPAPRRGFRSEPLRSRSRLLPLPRFVSCPQQDGVSSRPPLATKEAPRPPSPLPASACAQGVQSTA